MDVFHRPNMIEFTSEKEEEKYYIQYELYTLWDTNNGLTLCIDCYDIYDALLCCIKATTVTTSSSGSSDKEDAITNTTAITTTTALTTTVTTANTNTTTYTITVANALKSHPIYTDKWLRLDGTSVALPDRMFMNRWPSVVLLQYRENMYDKYTLENHPLEVTLPYECMHCGMRT